jgi:hypothetical protein
MEHASVAAFARFTLQLLHLGAPRELIEQSQRALLDETEHTKACFELASRYHGTPVGPGRLPMDAALADNELESIALMAFLEGCVGETVATLEASAAGEQATDPEVRRVLGRIAQDEMRHAELAWRFVAWALARGGLALKQRLALELGQLEAELLRAPRVLDAAGVPEHGVLSGARQMELRREALAEVVLPCAYALLGGTASGSSERPLPSRSAHPTP